MQISEKLDLTFVTTGDGSRTLYHPKVGEHYHSKFGAVQESRHVFVQSGLDFFLTKRERDSASILEVGFGTGLNFLMSAQYAQERDTVIEYVGIEAFPLSATVLSATGYGAYVSPDIWEAFIRWYPDAQQAKVAISSNTMLDLKCIEVLKYENRAQFDVVYFDAFAAVHQPEMWTEETLGHVGSFLHPGGVFVTYAITGELKRTMKRLGFTIQKAPGAPGKREMLRAVKM